MFALLVTCLALAPEGAAQELRPRFTTNQEFLLRVQSWATVEGNASGTLFEYKVRLDNVRKAKVLDVAADGTARLELEYLEYEMYINGPSGETPAKGAFKHYLGTKVVIRVTPTGEVAEVERLEEYLKTLRAKSSGLSALFGSFMRPENIKLELEQLFDFYPAKPVRAGDNWSKDSRIAAIDAGEWKVKNNYSYRGPSGVNGQKRDLIDLRVELKQEGTTPLKGIPHLSQSKSIAYDIESMTGVIWLDPTSSLPVVAELEGVIKQKHQGKQAERAFDSLFRVKQRVTIEPAPTLKK